MKATLFYDLTTKVIGDGTDTWTPPTLVFGESLVIGLRFQETVSGAQNEVSRTVNYLKVGSGPVDARPVAGTWRLKIGGGPQTEANTTAALDWNVGAQSLQAAVNALGAVTSLYGQVVISMLAGSYLLKFGTGAMKPALAVVESELHPPCFEQINAWQVANQWVSSLRLCQAPVAFSDGSERVLPSSPTMSEIQAGGSDGSGEFTWNEIQQMTMPPFFRGTYQFKRNNIRTTLLSYDDDVAAITTALAVYGDTITATMPRSGVARIEFSGDFKGTQQPLLDIAVVDTPEGNLTFAIALDKPPLAAMLCAKESVTLPLEIELGIADDTAPGGVDVHKIRTSITIQRGVILPMLAAAAGINWLRPVPTDYVPFTRDQIITGQQFYACPLGDGEAVEFVVDHNLATDNIAAVLLRENASDGKMLVMGVDYSVTVAGENSLTVTLSNPATPPATDGLGLVITAAGPAAVFQAHTHTIEQIVGLETALETVATRLTVLEGYLPSTSPGTTDSSIAALTITIPSTEAVLFYTPPSTAKSLDLTAMPVCAPYLLPAVHQADAAVVLPSPLPSPAANSIWTAAAHTLVPGTGRIASSYAAAGGFVASDGRILYPAQRQDNTASYYPAPFEQPLFEFGINEDMLPLNRTLEVKFGLAVQLVNATSEAQWVLVIEHGVLTDQIAPNNTDINLENVVWNPIPLLKKRLVLTGLATTHTFGCRIKHTADTTLAVDKMLYGTWSTVTGTAPTSANFVLRARLIEFDTKNNVPDATGWLYHKIIKADGSEGNITATISL